MPRLRVVGVVVLGSVSRCVRRCVSSQVDDLNARAGVTSPSRGSFDDAPVSPGAALEDVVLADGDAAAATLRSSGDASTGAKGKQPQPRPSGSRVQDELKEAD